MVTISNQPIFLSALNRQMPGTWKIFFKKSKYNASEVWFRYIGKESEGVVMFNQEELSLAFNENEVALIVCRKLQTSPSSYEDFVLETLAR